MKKLSLLLLLINIVQISFAQTAADYYIQLCITNQSKLYTPPLQLGSGWSERNTTYSIIQTDSINGVLYFLKEGREYSFLNPSNSHVFQYFWIREDINGEILLKAYADTVTTLANATILPVEFLLFSNNIFTAGYSTTMTSGTTTNTDSIISTNATWGGYNNCIQIRSTRKESGVISMQEDIYYAFGIGEIGENRTFPINEIHSSSLVSSFTTGCQAIVDSLTTANVDSCLGQYLDYYVNNLQIDTINHILTVDWIFHDSTITNLFTQSYPYQYAGNNVISINIQCNNFLPSSETFYKTVYIGSSQVGLNEVNVTDLNLIVYPNPANEYIYLKYNSDPKIALTVNIYNMTGELIKSVLNFKETSSIDIKEFENGIYLIETKSANSSATKKFLINR